jgi:hypothetical protein
MTKTAKIPMGDNVTPFALTARENLNTPFALRASVEGNSL